MELLTAPLSSHQQDLLSTLRYICTKRSSSSQELVQAGYNLYITAFDGMPLISRILKHPSVLLLVEVKLEQADYVSRHQK